MGPIQRGKGVLFKPDPAVCLPLCQILLGGPGTPTPALVAGTVGAVTRCQLCLTVGGQGLSVQRLEPPQITGFKAPSVKLKICYFLRKNGHTQSHKLLSETAVNKSVRRASFLLQSDVTKYAGIMGGFFHCLMQL